MAFYITSRGLEGGIPARSDPKASKSPAPSPTTGGAKANVLSGWQVSQITVTGEGVIPLRKNRTTSFPATWRRFPAISGAAMGYHQNGAGAVSLRIRARFTGRGVGRWYKLRIYEGARLVGGPSNSVRVSKRGTDYIFTIKSFRMHRTEFSRKTLRFEFRASKSVATSASITCFTFPAKPNRPWSTASNVVNNPWTDVLHLLWNKGRAVFNGINNKTSKTEIAIAITKIVNSKLGLIYEEESGATVFGISRAEYLLSDFLAHLKQQPERGDSGRRVNCTDCACAVTTFANLLGCNLYNVVFGGYYDSDGRRGFGCNKVLTLRSDNDLNQTWDYPFSNGRSGGFGYHEISMEGDYLYTSKIYDACLKVNRNVVSNGQDNNRSPLLPAHTPFAFIETYQNSISDKQLEQHYKEWLVYNDVGDLNRAKLSANRGIRSIQ